MFAQKNRLTKDKDFEKVFKTGKSAYNKFLGIKTISNDLSENRYGILVGTKVSKKAVERNKIKRRIREILKKSDLKKGFDVVVIALPLISDKNFTQIKEAIYSNLEKLKLLK